MERSRRQVLAAGASLLTAGGLAGCNLGATSGSTDTAGGTPDAETSGDGGSTGTASGGTDRPVEKSGPAGATSAETAVAAEWNAMRARVWDALSLGLAGETGTGAAVAQDVFARFEAATGEYGAHEVLEATAASNYAEFEEALGELRTAGLEAGDVERAREEARIANTQLGDAQRQLVGETAARVFDLQLLGVTARNAAVLAAADGFEGARATADAVLSRFEEASVHDALESADAGSYEAFESAVKGISSAAKDGNGEKLRSEASAAYTAAIEGSYALAGSETTAGVGHLATLQARGWDAAALADLGGPSTDYAHAAALTLYRARTDDCRWLAARGETDRAATMASDIFAHFEGARAHEALEKADGEAYEGFESGLSALQSAVENGDSAGIDEAVATVDENLVAGVEALAGSNAPLLEAAFFRARLADARERYRLGGSDAAASVAQGLFERFEANELDFHETVESTSEDLYAKFEEEHLAGLIEAFEKANDEGVGTHYEGAQSTLLEFETRAGSTATVSGAEAAYVGARGFDAAVLAALGENGRAQSVAQGAFEHFEAGAGGYHEALEAADESLYGTFEKRLGVVATAAGNGEDVYPVVTEFNVAVLDSAYAIVQAAGGSHRDAAATAMQNTFAHFEEARVHELLEKADHNAYETFEGRLKSFLAALENGGKVDAAAESFVRATQYAAFALVDSVERAPIDLDLAGTSGSGSGSNGSGGDGGSGGGGESDLQGGPNVVEGVPGDADHVVEMKAVAFEPTELTVSKGDTVAWKHTAGEAHSVTAYGGKLPDGAGYWASGDFDSEDAARSGWENGKGAVQSGQSFVHTFETTGTHEYCCIPHEAAGMVGSVTVE